VVAHAALAQIYMPNFERMTWKDTVVMDEVHSRRSVDALGVHARIVQLRSTLLPVYLSKDLRDSGKELMDDIMI
jgi:hypothetical protein